MCSFRVIYIAKYLPSTVLRGKVACSVPIYPGRDLKSKMATNKVRKKSDVIVWRQEVPDDVMGARASASCHYFFWGGGAVQTQEKGKERKMMAIQPNRCPREEAGKEDDPVKEVIRLVVQTWFREEHFQVCFDMLEYRKTCVDACWNGYRPWRVDRWTWADFTPVSRPDDRNGRRKAPSTRNGPLRLSWTL